MCLHYWSCCSVINALFDGILIAQHDGIERDPSSILHMLSAPSRASAASYSLGPPGRPHLPGQQNSFSSQIPSSPPARLSTAALQSTATTHRHQTHRQHPCSPRSSRARPTCIRSGRGPPGPLRPISASHPESGSEAARDARDRIQCPMPAG